MPTEHPHITESDLPMEDTTPHFFPTPEDLRAWFAANHDKVDVMWVGYYKKATKLPTVTLGESVDAALCFGWIDGLKRTVNDKAYKIRFTPRRRRSRWSARNLARMKQLLAQGVVAEPGRVRVPKARQEQGPGGVRTGCHKAPSRIREAYQGGA